MVFPVVESGSEADNLETTGFSVRGSFGLNDDEVVLESGFVTTAHEVTVAILVDGWVGRHLAVS